MDPGSNVHIVFDSKLLHNYKTTADKSVGQVSGDRKPVAGIGDWHITIGEYSIILHDVLCMPDNPSCTLSTGALKRNDGFICASHDALAHLHLVCPIGIDEKFSINNGNFKTINGLDYIPLITHYPRLKEDLDSDEDWLTAPDLNEHPDGEGYISNAVLHTLNPRRSNRLAGKVKPTIRKSARSHKPSEKYKAAHPSTSPIPVKSTIPRLPTRVCVPTNFSDLSVNGDDSIDSPYKTKQKQQSVVQIDNKIDNTNHHLVSLMTHLKFGCKNMQNIIHMSKNVSLSHLPKNIRRLSHPCPICIRCKMPRLSRQPSVPLASLRPGQMLQVDFAFMNKPSIRGFSSYLTFICVSTKYTFRFCSRSKRAPKELIRWVLNTLQNQNKKTNFIRFDEGGELARCEEIPKMLVEEFGITMQTTGGYASHLNGTVERSHRTSSESVRTFLYTAGLSDEFWCFALMYANYVARRWCQYPDTITPYEKWTHTKPSFNKLHIFGATIYVHDSACKKLDDRAQMGIFLGYAATTSVVYYYDKIKKTIKRAHHVKIDNYQIGGSDETPGSKMITKYATLHSLKLPEPSTTLHTVSTPFHYNDLFSYETTIPPRGPLGLILENDEVFGLPIINKMNDGSPFLIGCKKILQKNAWIISLHHDEPVTYERFLAYIDYLRTQNILRVTLTLAKRVSPQATNFQTYRNYFDNFRPIAAHAKIIIPDTRYAYQCPSKPPTPKCWGDVVKGAYKDVWYKSVFERYDKNHKVGLLSVPIPRTKIPDDAIVLRSVSAFKIKNTNRPDIFDFYFRMCADGSRQIKGLHFDESHSPVPCTWTILTSICVAAASGLTAYIIDVDNAFQNTPRYPDENTKPLFITCPPLYLPWFKQRFPHFQIDSQVQSYVLQCFMNMQGMRTAGRDFHSLLTAVLEQLHIRPTSVDKGIFVFIYKASMVLLAISTDDILLFTQYPEVYEQIQNKLQQAFGTTTQTGTVLSYLNYRIIQSTHAISVDQTDFIQSIVNQYIPATTKSTKIDTPLRTDRNFDNEIKNSIPATEQELKQLCIEYKSDFRTIFGQLCHIMKASRPDIANAINRLGVFQAAPNRLAFKSVYRILQYLKTHPNVPLVYPKQPFTSSTTFRVYSSSGDEVERISVPHCLCGHVDISFAPHKEDRHSVGGHLETLNGVSVDWKTQKQMSCATSATDAETRQYYTAAKRIIRLRNFLRQIGVLLPSSSPITPSFKLNYELPTPVFEDNKGTRDMLAAGRVTSNLKHIDVPLTYLHTLHESSIIKTAEASSKTMLANFMTKQETGPTHLRSTKWATGREYYPPCNSDHYAELTKTAPLSLL